MIQKVASKIDSILYHAPLVPIQHLKPKLKKQVVKVTFQSNLLKQITWVNKTIKFPYITNLTRTFPMSICKFDKGRLFYERIRFLIVLT